MYKSKQISQRTAQPRCPGADDPASLSTSAAATPRPQTTLTKMPSSGLGLSSAFPAKAPPSTPLKSSAGVVGSSCLSKVAHTAASEHRALPARGRRKCALKVASGLVSPWPADSHLPAKTPLTAQTSPSLKAFWMKSHFAHLNPCADYICEVTSPPLQRPQG